MRMKKNETCVTVIQLIKEQFIPICYFNTIWGLLLLGPSACTEAAIVSAALQVSSNYMAIFLKIKKESTESSLYRYCSTESSLYRYCYSLDYVLQNQEVQYPDKNRGNHARI